MDFPGFVARPGQAISILVALILLFPAAVTAEMEHRSELSLKTGLRVDELDWNIAGFLTDDHYVNVLSELQWQDVESRQVQLSYRASGGEKGHWLQGCLRLQAGYGWIYSGRNQDSDYAGDNRTLEFSRTNNNADGGSVADISGGAGPQFRSRGGRLKVTPLAGYAWHEQDLTITDGFQTVPAQGPFPGLDSDYEARWKGPWLGLDVEARGNRWRFSGAAEIHLVDYEAQARWNLREDLAQPVSFEHEADGYGLVLSGQSGFALSERWSVLVEARYKDFWTDSGVDRVFHVDSSGDVSVNRTRLNEVNWQSLSGSLGIAYRFD